MNFQKCISSCFGYRLFNGTKKNRLLCWIL